MNPWVIYILLYILVSSVITELFVRYQKKHGNELFYTEVALCFMFWWIIAWVWIPIQLFKKKTNEQDNQKV
jgi:hypothetical protein